MSSAAQKNRLSLAVEASRLRAEEAKTVRRKCFVSYHAEDIDEVTGFVENFSGVFIPKVIGVSDSDPLVNSGNTDYIMQQIRARYLTDSTVTIVMIGKCTWARKYVDWEIFSTLRNDATNGRSGLMAVNLPSAGKTWHRLPDRLDDNIRKDEPSYAKYYVPPTSEGALREWIEDAFTARTTRTHLIANSRARKVNNSSC